MCTATERYQRARAGFTLIEVLCTLVLLGIISTVLLSVIAKGAQAYIEARHWSRDNTQLALALRRLYKELYQLDGVVTVSAHQLVFTSFGTDSKTTLAYLPTEHVLLLQGSVLLQDVRAVTLRLYAGDKAWTKDMPASRLSFVAIEVTPGWEHGGAEGVFRLGVCPRSNSGTGAPGMAHGDTL
ncbi:MAG: type II secretion system protein [Bilophila sp.]